MARGSRDPGYNEWLESAGEQDSKENRGWYNCPEEERSDYIKNHQEWWNNRD